MRAWELCTSCTRRSRGRSGNGRQPPRIDTLLREGQEVVVQVAKDPIGTKGARITSHLSIAGRHLVLTPWSKKVGVSRRIDSERERRRLREKLKTPLLGVTRNDRGRISRTPRGPFMRRRAMCDQSPGSSRLVPTKTTECETRSAVTRESTR